MNIKNFIIKNKYNIVIFLALLTDFLAGIQDMVGIGETAQFYVKLSLVLLGVIMARVQAVNEAVDIANQEANSFRKGAENVKNPFIRVTAFSMVGEFTHKFFSTISLKNYKKENALSHLLLGLSILLIVTMFPFPDILWQMIFLMSALTILALGFGFFMEIIQQKYYDGIPDMEDVIVTAHGYFLMIPVGILLRIYLPTVTEHTNLITWGLFVVTLFFAFKAHKDY
jgi:hypothetical protein